MGQAYSTLSTLIATCLLLAPPLEAQERLAEDSPRLDDAVRITCVDGVLKFEWADEQMINAVPITVRTPDAMWQVSALRSPRAMGIGINRVAGKADREGSFWSAAITATPDLVRITAARGGQTPQETRLSLTQRGDGSVAVAITRRQASARVNVQAKDLLELRMQHPQVVNEFINPLLEQLGVGDLLAPGATDVYRVFDEIERIIRGGGAT